MLAVNGFATTLWMRSDKQLQAINSIGENAAYLPGYQFDPTLRFTTELEQALEGADTVFFAVPSSALRQVAKLAKAWINTDALLISTAKGIEADSFALPSQILEQELPNAKVGVLSGPNLAKEIASYEKNQLFGFWSPNEYYGFLNTFKYEEDKVVLVSPDAGAYKKVFDVAKEFKIEKIITATKVRDLETGNIIRTDIPVLDQHNNLKYVIVDDICDGGRTFIELAKAIKDSRPTAEIYLVVTHGIFSFGFDFLVQYFDGIYCTNSVKDIRDGIIVDTFSRHKTIHSLVKQQNIF